MRTILLSIEYDGTDYAGWQIQPDCTTVQDVVEAALTKIVGNPVRIHSSSRTDAGVHARCMAAHFKTDSKVPLSAFREGANSHLPEAVAIRQVREMPEDFHARFSAKSKKYRYSIYQGEVRSPLSCKTSWHLYKTLDLELMREAASHLVGQHDFQAFRSSNCVAKTTTREIFQVDVSSAGEFVYLDFHGSRFLKNMVRMLVGTLVEVGQGKRSPDELRALLAGEDGVQRGPTAPARGLCLQEVLY